MKGFQLLDNEPFDNSLIKRDYLKVYHQPRAQLNQFNQNIDLVSGENNNYHQIGISYLEFNKTVRKNDTTNFHYNNPVGLVNHAFAFCFTEARFSTTCGSDIEQSKFCGQISTIMKAISNKDGDLLSQFHNINENDIPILERIADLQPQIRDTPHQKMLLKNHTDAKKGKDKRYLYLEDIFGFCKSFGKVTINLGFHVMLKTNNLQDNIYTSTTDDIHVTVFNLYQFVPNLIPFLEIQLIFNEATQKSYKIAYDEYNTERRVISDMIVQVDIGSAQQVSSPKKLICAHQKQNRIGVADKKNCYC